MQDILLIVRGMKMSENTYLFLLLNLTIVAMYQLQLDPFDTVEMFPLSCRELSKCLLISFL